MDKQFKKLQEDIARLEAKIDILLKLSQGVTLKLEEKRSERPVVQRPQRGKGSMK